MISGDSLGHQNKADFTTKDRDNDDTHGNCANIFTGAWWYKSCHHSNLNGAYGDTNYGKGINWHDWKGYHASMTGTRMMVRSKP